MSITMKPILIVLLSAACSATVIAASRIDKPGLVIGSKAYAPAKGSVERKSIMDALRVMTKNMSDLDVIFVVRYLKVKGDWAWVVVEPASRDGTQHYETLSGLLNKKNGGWKYLEGPPEAAECDEDPDCVDSSRYFRKSEKKYPSLSPDIFPKE